MDVYVQKSIIDLETHRPFMPILMASCAFFPKKGKRYMRLSVYLYGGMFGLFTCKPFEY